MAAHYPDIGQWFRRPEGTLFEVVATDEDDGTVEISDAVATLGVLFLGQGEITCDDAADSNDDGVHGRNVRDGV